MKRYFLYFLSFFLLNFIYRLICIPDLGFGVLSDLNVKIFAIIIGILSDIWVSIILAFLSLALNRASFFALLFIHTTFLAFHIPYIHFFKAPLQFVHLAYLVDFDFIRSSAKSSFTPWLFLIYGAAFVCAFLSEYKFKPNLVTIKTSAKIKNGFTYLLILTFGIFFNYLSGKMSRHFNFPTKLTLHPYVAFSTTFKEQRDHYKNTGVSELELEEIQNYVQKNNPSQKIILDKVGSSSNSIHLLKNTEIRNQTQQQKYLDVIRHELNQKFTPQKLKSEPKYFFIVLLESARSLESKLMSSSPEGQMPELDSYLMKGIAFPKGTSTGTVSRSGGESTICNSLSSIYFNAMRNTPQAVPQCAKELLIPLFAENRINSRFAWLHGGYQSFDSQGQFWSRAKFESPIDTLKAPRNLTRTLWGLSDKAFLNESLQWLSSSQMPNGLMTASFVTLSNHNEWDLPEDADDEIKALSHKLKYKHWVTARYTDKAVANFFEQLKKLGIWNDSVVVLAGDHGMEEPSIKHENFTGFGNSKESDFESATALTNIYYGISGGLTENAVKHCQELALCPNNAPLVIANAVSQADILPTLFDLLGYKSENGLFGTSLFSTARFWPVIADTGDEFLVHWESAPLFKKTGSEVYIKKDFFNSEFAINSPERIIQIYLKTYLTAAQKGNLR